MKLKKINNFFKFLPFYLLLKFNSFFLYLSSIENIILRNKISNIKFRRIIVCGYPRSGTTFITELINKDKKVTSLLYKNLPFIFTLFFWNKINNLYYYGIKIKRRSHGDKILISPNSPDSFEEIFWSSFIEDYRKSGFKKKIDENYKNIIFEDFLKKQIQKLIFLNNNVDTYLSKGNYFIYRLKYINKIDPNSKFIICIRNPIEQCISAVKTNKIFYENFRENSYYKMETDFICHFEFGHLKKSIMDNNFYSNETPNDLNKNYKYFLKEWIYTYNTLLTEYAENKGLKEKIIIINYNDLNNQKLKKMCDFCDLKNFNDIEKYFNQNFSRSNYKADNKIINVNDKVKDDIEKEALCIFNKIIKFEHTL